MAPELLGFRPLHPSCQPGWPGVSTGPLRGISHRPPGLSLGSFGGRPSLNYRAFLVSTVNLERHFDTDDFLVIAEAWREPNEPVE